MPVTKLAIIGALGAVALGGGVGGAAVGAGALDPVADGTVELTLDPVPIFACPNGDTAGDLHRGDRIYATARSEDGAWLEIRSPQDTNGSVWVETRWIDPDAPFDALPEGHCAPSPENEASENQTGQTTTTTTASDPYLLTAPAENGTVSPGDTVTSPDGTVDGPAAPVAPGGNPPEGSPPPPSTPGPADNTGPSLGGINADPREIWEDALASCPSSRTARITVTVDDPSGVASVTLDYQVGAVRSSVPMSSSGGIYSATIGPFDHNTVSMDSVAALAVTAEDTVGNVSKTTSGSALTLRNCTIN